MATNQMVILKAVALILSMTAAQSDRLSNT